MSREIPTEQLPPDFWVDRPEDFPEGIIENNGPSINFHHRNGGVTEYNNVLNGGFLEGDHVAHVKEEEVNLASGRRARTIPQVYFSRGLRSPGDFIERVKD